MISGCFVSKPERAKRPPSAVLLVLVWEFHRFSPTRRTAQGEMGALSEQLESMIRTIQNMSAAEMRAQASDVSFTARQLFGD